MNNEFNNQFNNDNNFNNDYGMGNQPVQPQYNDQTNNMNGFNQGGFQSVQPNPVPPVQPQFDNMNNGFVPNNSFNQPVQPQYNNQTNNMNSFNQGGFQPVQPNPVPPVQPQYNNMNNGFAPNNNFNQPMYQNGQNFGPQPNSPYTNSNSGSKGSMIGIIGVIAVVVIALIFIVPMFTSPSPKGTWSCQSTSLKTLNFTSKNFTFSGTYSGINTTLTGKYKLHKSNVKPAKKKDGYKYYLYKATDVKAVAGSSSQTSATARGFILGFSSDKKTIHYLSKDDNSAMSFECTKNDN